MSSPNYLRDLAKLRQQLAEAKSPDTVKKTVDELFLLRKSLEKQLSSINYELNRGLTMYAELTNTEVEKNSWNIAIDRDSHYAVELVDDVVIPVERVAELNHVPDHPVFYVEALDQFAVKIAGVTFRGNIGNIFNGKQSNKPKIKTLDARAHNINKFHMDPKKYVKPDIRNFSDSSWVYCRGPRVRKNAGMRHIGSRDRLREDLDEVIPSDKEMLRSQLIHDLLVNVCIKYNA